MSIRQLFARHERGTVLVVGIVLLLLLSLVVLFGSRITVQEQRVSGSDLRARLVKHAAEAGLNHAMEYVRLNSSTFLYAEGQSPTTATWQLCGASETTFPCGAAEATRRGSTYRYMAGIDRNGDSTIDLLERSMLPFTEQVASAGAFEIDYGVGALLCTLDDNGNCTTTPSSRNGRSAISLVSRAEIPGENARATHTRTVGNFPVFSLPANVPPVVAAGIVAGIGTSTLVPNPDAGGPGVPVSVWSRFAPTADNGTWRSCPHDAYFKACGAIVVDGVPKCPSTTGGPSRCGGSELSHGRGAGASALTGAGGGTHHYGPDILTPGQNKTRLENGVNAEGVTYLASNYFPCDLFEYVFGLRARGDPDGANDTARGDPDGDGFCEKDPDTATGDRIEDVDDFLEGVATQITDCSGLNSSSSGIYWVKAAGCDLPGAQVGSPKAPVVIIAEGDVGTSGGTEFFGLMFVRWPFGGLAKDGSQGYGWSAGGGTGTVYGAVIMEGGATINGTVDIIYSSQVLSNLNASNNLQRFGNAEGSWSDLVSY